MKKEYINPTIQIFKVETQQMIADSGGTRNVGLGDEGDAGEAESRQGLGRRRRVLRIHHN